MDDGFVRGRARGRETRKFGVDAVALQNVSGRYKLAASLIGHGPLYDRPVDTAGKVILGRVDYILKAAINNRFERIEPRLGVFARPVVVSSPAPTIRARSAPATGAAFGGAAVIADRPGFPRSLIDARAVVRPPVTRISVWRWSLPRRCCSGVRSGLSCDDFVGLGRVGLYWARR